MPIRRAAATPSQEKTPSPEKTPSAAAEKGGVGGSGLTAWISLSSAEAEAPPEDSPPADQGPAASSAAASEPPGGKAAGCLLKDGYKYEKSKVKKVKRTVPAWASISASKKVLVTNFSGSQHRVDDVLLEAIMSCSNKAGVSYQSLLKYVVKKYPGMEIEKKKFLLKKAMKKHLEKGTIKQLKGKGLSGTFAIGNKPVLSKKCAQKMESLGDALPLIITRLCEPKEASYNLIRKYLEQHFPHLRIDSRPDVLRTALVKAVERGQLERITGKGASGTFQLKRTGNKVLLGGALEDAIAAAITAMNEPKTCSTTILRRYLLDANKDRKQYQLVAHLRRTLSKCKVLGWMEQITGHGFNGTYQLSFPFYPRPSVLFQEMLKQQPRKRKKKASQESEEDDDNETCEEAPTQGPPRRLARPPHPAKKAASSAILAARNPKVARKEPAAPPPPKATPTKKSAPARKTRTPAVKKMSRRGSRPGQEAPQRRRAAPRRSKVEASGRDSAPSRK
uniref:Heterochromatin protein 1-binding protein 3 n=1 Tax=Tetraodon nigroviridis TaxID=99883 RepID=H3C3H8_TETNG